MKDVNGTMNNIYSFKAYQGQGERYITCKDLKSAGFFVNIVKRVTD